MTPFAAASVIILMAGTSAVTPLYRIYQQTMNLTPFWITVVFASYVVSLLAALLTVGGLSDYVGRRPVMLAALLINAAAMMIFAEADSLWQLIAARMVQGLSVGIGTTAFGAAILDTSRTRGPLLNSVAAFLGMTAGALVSATLIVFVPDPLHAVYVVVLAFTLLMLLLLVVMPESCTPKDGAWASLRPHVAVPPQSQPVLARLTPANVGAWSLGGFYLSLMPTVVATAMKVASPWIGGLVVSALMLTAALAVAVFRHWPARRLVLAGASTVPVGVAISMIGIQQQHVLALLAGTIIAGAGFGASFSGTLRALLPTAHAHERAGLLSAFYLQSYLAFAVPAVAAGLSVPLIGLSLVAYIYGAVIIVLTIVSGIATLMSKG
ncbi:putative permease of the major facilitator superfamily (MFS); putative Mutlidrug resistance protein [Bradyrhizobium sp. ORS 278]|nr:putative permease of the major facilitator superfamily (MFS); putative Mutlidrug resistance protein [Bradyrhizobium sp. ORS 278]